jgi:outer membrane protein TolC
MEELIARVARAHVRPALHHHCRLDGRLLVTTAHAGHRFRNEIMTTRCGVLLLLGTLGGPVAVAAQTPAPDALFHGVPTAPATGQPLAVSLADAVHRGLEHNLAIIVEQQQVATSHSARLEALSALVPHVGAHVQETHELLSTAAFGFTGFGFPTLIGPFNVFDARITLSTPLIDVGAVQDLRSERALATAAEANLADVRETVILAIGNLYLETTADAARVASAQSQVTTADTLARLAQDQQASGLVARVDVVRQQVQLASARARLIAAQNALAKRKLQLARAIGLPADQEITLTDAPGFTPAPPLSLDAAVAEAASHRQDVRRARARAAAAHAAQSAAIAARYPNLHLDADVGVIGPTTDTADRTFNVTATVRVPIFEGGHIRADVARATALARQRDAELADAVAGVRYEVTAAFLDLNAAAASVDVAESAEALAREELTQAQDRFRAGVASSIELAQAQDAVAQASEQYIASVYAHTVAKAAVARTMGEVETRFLELVGGSR